MLFRSDQRNDRDVRNDNDQHKRRIDVIDQYVGRLDDGHTNDWHRHDWQRQLDRRLDERGFDDGYERNDEHWRDDRYERNDEYWRHNWHRRDDGHFDDDLVGWHHRNLPDSAGRRLPELTTNNQRRGRRAEPAVDQH